MRKYLISILSLLLLASCETVPVASTITVERVLDRIETDTLWIEFTPEIEYTSDSLFITRPFRVLYDTVVQTYRNSRMYYDTIYMTYDYPSNEGLLIHNSPPDTLYKEIQTKTNVIVQEPPWWQVPLYSVIFLIVGVLIGRIFIR